MLQCSHHTFNSVLLIPAFSTLVIGSQAIMKQQIPNDRLNNKGSDHDTSQRFVHFRIGAPFTYFRLFDGNEEGLVNFAVRGSNTAQWARVRF